MTEYEKECKRKMEVINRINSYARWDDVQKVYFIQSYLLHWVTEEQIDSYICE